MFKLDVDMYMMYCQNVMSSYMCVVRWSEQTVDIWHAREPSWKRFLSIRDRRSEITTKADSLEMHPRGAFFPEPEIVDLNVEQQNQGNPHLEVATQIHKRYAPGTFFFIRNHSLRKYNLLRTCT